jgi:asparagine synthase (glutamine-hydrolysing)
MCGFAGFLSFGATGGDAGERRQLLQRMADAIAHRGPDDAQYYDDGTLALAFRRLSIIDVEGGNQPLFNEDATAFIAANAEIYNHRVLREQLAARHRFASRSDCEVALHAFEEWGDAAIQRLTGMFALAIWDRQAKRLLLARDRLGIKPLYVCRLPDGLLFGSELKALLVHPLCPRELDWSALERPAITQAPQTSYVRGVELLSGGHTLVATSTGTIREQRYWSIDEHLGAAPFGENAAAYTDAYAHLLEQVVLDHLQRDVAAGVHLSGGLDSCLLPSLVARHGDQLPCFTVVERSNYLAGDVDSARRLTQRLGVPWFPVRFDYRTVVDEMKFDLDRFEQAIWMMDSPRFDLEWLFKEELHRRAKEAIPNLKVVLLGQGADEFAGGYSTSAERPRSNWAHYLADAVVPNLVQNQAFVRGGGIHLRPWLGDQLGGSEGIGPYHRLMSLLCRQLQHHNLWHEDRSSSWHSLEARVPFLDHRLVELLASVPESLHESLFWNKQIVRETFRRAQPDHELKQPKVGFLDAADTGSTDIIVQTMVERIARPFHEKYMRDGRSPFDGDRVGDLIDRVTAKAANFRSARQQLLECMAITVFDMHCRTGGQSDVAPGRSEVALPLVRPSAWADLDLAMSAPASGPGNWVADERVRLRSGVEVVAPLRTASGRPFLFVAEGTVVGRIEAPSGCTWVDSFLRNLGEGVAEDFTIRDWLDEFDIPGAELVGLLDVLAKEGLLVRSLVHWPAGHGDAQLADIAKD